MACARTCRCPPAPRLPERMTDTTALDGAATPGARYAHNDAQQHKDDDPAQRTALAELDRIHAELVAADAAPRRPRWWRTRQPAPPVRGLYLWGDVGRGKTFLADLLFGA